MMMQPGRGPTGYAVPAQTHVVVTGGGHGHKHHGHKHHHKKFKHKKFKMKKFFK